jgi:hypothetical protein
MAKRKPRAAASENNVRLSDNRPAIMGFILAVVQLLAHGSWMALVTWLSESGRAKELDTDSPMAWAIVILLGLSTVLTFVALFVCLFYGLRRRPRTLAIIGFAMSFFMGVFGFAIIILSFLRFTNG